MEEQGELIVLSLCLLEVSRERKNEALSHTCLVVGSSPSSIFQRSNLFFLPSQLARLLPFFFRFKVCNRASAIDATR